MKDDDDREESDVASENEYETKDEQDEDNMANSNNGKSEPQQGTNSAASGGENREVKKPKLDPKDPLRPRRKKARRACFACQRAHLTCGDERPCQRCIKRGLADACQDGVRKKAKYLHDAPPEALRPVLGPNYNPNGSNPPNRMNSIPNGSSASDSSPSVANFFPGVNNNSPNFMQYQQMRHNGMPPPQQMPDPTGVGVGGQMPFLSQQNPISPQFAANQQLQANMHMAGSMAAPEMKMGDPNQFSGPLFDPSNPALFNFDLDSLNFGNHYGAMEFSMLNHMSSGAAETPPNDASGLQGHGNFDGGVYPNAVQYGNAMYGDAGIIGTDNFGNLQRQDSAGNIYTIPQSHLPRAYAIEQGPISNPSPSTDAHASPQSLMFDASPKQTFANTTQSMSSHQQKAMQAAQAAAQASMQQQRSPERPKPKFPSHLTTAQPPKSNSSVYATVTEPYSYTTGFHSLTAFIQRRFSPSGTLKIAKSLASIRPSFIACTKTLTREDLVFMEKCLVRTLVEYEWIMRDCSTPTLVCRRSGEVAAVNKEFSLLTGWSRNVLLGREPNLNVNQGSAKGSRNSSALNSGRAGLATPRNGVTGEKGRPSYVLLAELLDDDSVITFYEDFARLAFGDSRGSVSKRCKVLKYKAKIEGDESSSAEEEKPKEESKSGQDMMLGGRVSKIDGEWGIGRLERDGKLDCSYCWTVKRDVFDIPMLIVMNFLPCI